MPGASDDSGDGEAEAGRSASRSRAIALIVLVFAALVFLGDSPGNWLALRGTVPGTGGLVAKGHLIPMALLLVIANFVLRMPRQGGPLSGASSPEGDDRGGDDDGE